MVSPKEQESAALRAWSESAPYWHKHAAMIRAMFEPLSDALIQDAAIGPGKSTLDVAAGTGEPSLRIAEACGASAAVTCTDAVADMVAAAKHEAGRRSLRNVTFARCAAEALPFRAGWFDAVVCRLGIMFSADPIASLREMLRVLEPGGRLALAVWHGRGRGARSWLPHRSPPPSEGLLGAPIRDVRDASRRAATALARAAPRSEGRTGAGRPALLPGRPNELSCPGSHRQRRKCVGELPTT